MSLVNNKGKIVSPEKQKFTRIITEMPDINIDGGTWESFKADKISVHVCGHLLKGHRSIRGAEHLSELLFGEDNRSDLQGVDLKSLLAGISGNFSIIVEGSGFFFAAVDISRTCPVFYSGSSFNDLKFYDRLPMAAYISNGLNQKSVNEFFELGFVTGDETVFEGIYQLRAGEYLYADQNTFKKERYFTYVPQEPAAEFTDHNSFAEQFDGLLTEAFSSMIGSFPANTQWVVPLSGGHDSRLVVNYLKESGADDVICFSYGTPGNEQSAISKQVADSLGYEWIFIEYSDEKWKELHDEGVIDRYVDYSFNGVSNPHYQDLLAVYELKKLNLITKKAVFVPGHTSISEAGFMKPDTKDPIALLIKNSKGTGGSDLPTKLYEKISELYQTLGNQPHLLSENFDWQENQAKYINNSLRVYQFFGYESAIPLWYKNVADFWLKLPYELSVNRNGLYIAEQNGVLIDSLLHLPFAKAKRKKRLNLKEIVKRLIPRKLMNIVLSKSSHKHTHAESLNDVFALKGETIGDVLQPAGLFPEEHYNLIQHFIDRRPYQISVYQLSKYYTLRKLFEQKKIR